MFDDHLVRLLENFTDMKLTTLNFDVQDRKYVIMQSNSAEVLYLGNHTEMHDAIVDYSELSIIKMKKQKNVTIPGFGSTETI